MNWSTIVIIAVLVGITIGVLFKDSIVRFITGAPKPVADEEDPWMKVFEHMFFGDK